MPGSMMFTACIVILSSVLLGSAQVCVPPAGLFCCPTVGPNGLFLQTQQTGPFSIFCNYGSGSSFVECIYDPLTGSGATIPGCPSRAPINPNFPTTCALANELHPNASGAKCVDLRGNSQANGTPVQIYDCNGSAAQQWIFSRGNTQIRLAGTNFCLDAGSTPGNGVGMKVWQCYNLPAQNWVYTTENQFVLSGTGLCLDLTGGNLANSNQLQLWQCGGGNMNQLWT